MWIHSSINQLINHKLQKRHRLSKAGLYGWILLYLIIFCIENMNSIRSFTCIHERNVLCIILVVFLHASGFYMETS